MDSLFAILLFLAIVTLFIGLIRPTIFNRVFKKEFTRKNVLVYFGGVTIAFFVLFAIFFEPSTTPTTEQGSGQAVTEQQEEVGEVEEEVVVEEEQKEISPQTETVAEEESVTQTSTSESQTQQQQPPQQQIEPEPKQEQQPEPAPVSDGKKWYVSSYRSSEYYYCEESDGWKNLSETYLRVYDSEAALLADYPSHTLHESCQ